MSRFWSSTALSPALILATGAWLTACGSPEAPEDTSEVVLPEPHPDLPADFQQLLPRGHFASVDDPVLVPAAEAELPDDAWVLGVEMDGVAHAYSLNLLNHHEVVNDRIGGTAFAAVW